MAKAHAADAVIFGSVGGPKWDKVPYDVRPEAGLLRLRKDLALYANLRPAVTYPALADASALKRELVEGLDIMILRELTGGVYFGEPKTITDLGNGQKRAIDTQVYDSYEIERIGRVAFELARKRRNKVTSMEKRNVMKTGVLWNEVITRCISASSRTSRSSTSSPIPAACSSSSNPKQFDVVVTDNLFGDMLSDIAAMLTGSLGMLASASLGDIDPKTKKRKALYEPVHGSAPDIAGKGIANPIAMIASFGMGLRYSFNMGKEADLIDQAIAATLGARLAHRRHHVGGRHARRHHRDGRRDYFRDGEAGGLIAAVIRSVEERVVLAWQEERVGDRPARHDVVVRHRRTRRVVIEAVDEARPVGPECRPASPRCRRRDRSASAPGSWCGPGPARRGR